MQPSCAAAGQCRGQFRPARAARNSDSPSFQEFQVVGCGKLMMPDCQSLCWSNSSAACWAQRGWKRPLRTHPAFAAQDPETGDHGASEQLRELIPAVNKRPRWANKGENSGHRATISNCRHMWTLAPCTSCARKAHSEVQPGELLNAEVLGIKIGQPRQVHRGWLIGTPIP